MAIIYISRMGWVQLVAVILYNIIHFPCWVQIMFLRYSMSDSVTWLQECIDVGATMIVRQSINFRHGHSGSLSINERREIVNHQIPELCERTRKNQETTTSTDSYHDPTSLRGHTFAYILLLQNNHAKYLRDVKVTIKLWNQTSHICALHRVFSITPKHAPPVGKYFIPGANRMSTCKCKWRI